MQNTQHVHVLACAGTNLAPMPTPEVSFPGAKPRFGVDARVSLRLRSFLTVESGACTFRTNKVHKQLAALLLAPDDCVSGMLRGA